MGNDLRQIKYHIQIVWGFSFFLPPCLIAISVALFIVLTGPDGNVDRLMEASEVFLPLLSFVFSSPIIGKEKDRNAFELVASRPPSVFYLFLLRWAIVQFFFWFSVAAVLGIACSFIELDVLQTLLIAFAPATFLSSLGCASANLTTDTNVGYLVPAIYWVASFWYGDLATHEWGQYVYLFSWAHRAQTETGIWQQNKLLLLLASICLLVSQHWVLKGYERFVKGSSS